jgi:PAS domain S-box-containing protein
MSAFEIPAPSESTETGDVVAYPPLSDAQRQRLLAILLGASPAMAVVFRLADSRIVYANAAAQARLDPGKQADIHKLTLTEVVGLSSLQKLQAEILPQAQVLGAWKGECLFRDVWGSEFPVDSVFIARSGDSGQANAYLCVFATLPQTLGPTRTSNATDAELLNAVLQTVPDCVYFKDRHSRFIRVSRAMAEKDGVDPAYFIGKTDFDRFTLEHAGPAYEAEQVIMGTGEPVLDLEEKETWPDGHVSWVSTSKFPLRNLTGEIVGTFGISREITAQKKSEAERREIEMQLQLSQKMESIGRLAAGVAHEVNTPTQFITDNTHFLTTAFQQCAEVVQHYRELREMISQKPEFAEAAEKIAKLERDSDLDYVLEEVPRCLQQTLDGLARVARIVRSLKEFAHPNSPDLTPADLNHTIETSILVSRHEWKYVSEVDLELDPNLPNVPCVVDEFNQVILNLIINAAHAIADALKIRGGDRGRITVRTRHAAPWAIVEVEDTGTGIAPEIRSRIFEPFFTTKPAGKGTGQGLAIVHTVIVKHHHGTIEVETEPGRGSKFVIKLPLQRASGAAAPAAAAATAQTVS